MRCQWHRMHRACGSNNPDPDLPIRIPQSGSADPEVFGPPDPDPPIRRFLALRIRIHEFFLRTEETSLQKNRVPKTEEKLGADCVRNSVKIMWSLPQRILWKEKNFFGTCRTQSTHDFSVAGHYDLCCMCTGMCVCVCVCVCVCGCVMCMCMCMCIFFVFFGLFRLFFVLFRLNRNTETRCFDIEPKLPKQTAW
jgi:hypothetical protein